MNIKKEGDKVTLKEKVIGFFGDRNLVIKTLLLIISFVFLIRLFNLQIVNGSEYRELSQNKMMRTTASIAARGNIYDRNGVVLASSKIGYDVVLYDTSISSEKLNEVLLTVANIVEKNKDKVISNLPMTLDGFNFVSESAKTNFLEAYDFEEGIEFDEALAKLCEKYKIENSLSLAEKLKILNLRYEITRNGYSLFTYVTIANNVSYETMAYIEEIKNELGGVVVLASPKRYYNYGESLAHVLGYVSSISSDEYDTLKEEGYSQNSIIGKTGLESFLEYYLKGTNGKVRAEINSSGTPTYEYVYEQAVSGKDVTLTIDYRLQSIAYKALEEEISALQKESDKYTDANAGAVVITNVNTGEVLSLVSYPSYDPNLFISGISYSDWNKLNSDENIPMFNRATQGTYSPGSTFKMISAIAGLETGKITSTELIQDTGVYPYSYNPVCWIYTDYHRTHGYINVSDAIKVSCNCYFYEVGRRVGIKTLVEYAMMFGLDKKTGIELTETTGTIAGTQDIDWYLGDTLSAAIGQSYNSFTPVELVNYIATLANGGTLNRLTLIKSVGDSNELIDEGELNEYIESKTGVGITSTQIELKDETLKTVLSGMERSSMESGGGTYYVFGRNDVEVAGKTGTAEVATGSANALFGGYAPIDNPEIAIVVVIEHGGSGLNAANVAKDIINEYYSIKKQENSVKSNQDISYQGISF